MSAFDAIRKTAIPKPMPPGELNETVDALRRAVLAATATVSTPDGAVEVTAGPGNAIVGLGFGRAAYRYSPERLGVLVVDTVRQATTAATGTINEVAGRIGRGRGRAELPGLLGGALPEVPAPEPADLDDLPDDGPADGPGRRATEVLRRVSQESQEQLRGYARLRAELTDLTATARSADGGVSAEVRAGGELLSIHIGTEQLRHDPATLAGIVHATVMTATAQAALLMADRVQRLTGPRLDVRSLIETYQNQSQNQDPDPDERRS